MQTTINQRLRKLVSHFSNDSQIDFCTLTGLKTANLSNHLKDDAKIFFEVIETIKKALPSVSAEWLITGNGAMLLTESIENESFSGVSEPPVTYKKKVISNIDEARELNYLDQIADLKGQIAFLKNEINKLQSSDNQEVK